MSSSLIVDLQARLSPLAQGGAFVCVPDNRPSEFITLNREGGRRENKLLDSVGIGIYCYAPTEYRACEIAESVTDALLKAPFADGYATVTQETMYSDPDQDTKNPRWYLSYTIQYYKPPKAQ